MEHIKFKCTEAERELLIKIAENARTIPQEQFSMGQYNMEGKSCSIGYFCCVILGLEENDCDNWMRQKLPSIFNNFDTYNKFHAWMFSIHWTESDDTPTGAADRIIYLLTNGLPKNWEKQMKGIEELCY